MEDYGKNGKVCGLFFPESSEHVGRWVHPLLTDAVDSVVPHGMVGPLWFLVLLFVSGLHRNVLVFFQGNGSDPNCMVPYMRAGQPSLHGYYACMVFWAKGTFGRNCRQNLRETSFSLVLVFFCVVETLFFWWRGLLVWYLWIGRAPTSWSRYY